MRKNILRTSRKRCLLPPKRCVSTIAEETESKVCHERTNFRMTKKETKPKEKPESPKLHDERHHSFPPEKNKEKGKNLLRRKEICTVIL
ncbi:hypothetical protein TNCV_2457191 [Trichonephila clavipes]|nr:hypothetical protein TNCV_2457191 [Trichonephila clavipes]